MKKQDKVNLVLAGAGVLVALYAFMPKGDQGSLGSSGGLGAGLGGLPPGGGGGGADTPTINIDFPALPPIPNFSEIPTKKEVLPFASGITGYEPGGLLDPNRVEKPFMGKTAAEWAAAAATKKEQKSGSFLGYGEGLQPGGGLLYKVGILKAPSPGTVRQGVTTRTSPTPSGSPYWDAYQSKKQQSISSTGSYSYGGGGGTYYNPVASGGGGTPFAPPSILPGTPNTIWR